MLFCNLYTNCKWIFFCPPGWQTHQRGDNQQVRLVCRKPSNWLWRGVSSTWWVLIEFSSIIDDYFSFDLVNNLIYFVLLYHNPTLNPQIPFTWRWIVFLFCTQKYIHGCFYCKMFKQCLNSWSTCSVTIISPIAFYILGFDTSSISFWLCTAHMSIEFHLKYQRSSIV